MKRLPQDPRITEPSFFRQTLDWMREAARAVNSIVDETLGLRVARDGTSGTNVVIEPINAGNGNAGLTLNKTGAAQVNYILGLKSGVARWQLNLGDATAEAGANAGSDASLNWYSDAGALLNSITFRRSDGRVGIPGHVVCSQSVSAGPSGADGFRTNGYVADGGNWQAFLAIGNPNWETVYQSYYHAPGTWAGMRWVVGSTTPVTFEMRNNGTGYSVGGWVATSDGRVKVNRQALGDVLAWIDEIEPCEYDRTDVKNMDGTPVHRVGFIANHFEPHAPALVMRDRATDDNPDPIRSLDYDGAGAYLWRAVQQLKALVQQQAQEIETLKGAIHGN